MFTLVDGINYFVRCSILLLGILILFDILHLPNPHGETTFIGGAISLFGVYRVISYGFKHRQRIRQETEYIDDIEM